MTDGESIAIRPHQLIQGLSWRLVVGVYMTIAAAVTAAGCGKHGAPIGSVSGRVTFASQPISQGIIVFENRTEARFRSAPLDSNGEYLLPEVNLGEYNVCIQPPEPERPSESSGTPAQIRAKMATVKIIDPKNIPRPFRSVDTTPLKRTVESGANTFDFDLATAQK